MFNFTFGYDTDIGDVKQTNQDCVLAKNAEISGHQVGLYIVADGCGGMAYGEEISKLAVTYFVRMWGCELPELLVARTVAAAEIDALLEKSIVEINNAALAFSKQVESKVGTTLSLLLAIDDRFYIKNVGDSRIYLQRGKKLLQLTQDQSLYAELIRSGQLSPQDAENFPRKNVLTMCIGAFEEIKVFSAGGRLQNGDTFLLCCDGLHNKVSTRRMTEVLTKKDVAIDKLPRMLRDSIAPGEANDNVSSVVCKYVGKKRKRWIFPMALVLLVLVLLVVVFQDRITAFLHEILYFSGCHHCAEILAGGPGT